MKRQERTRSFPSDMFSDIPSTSKNLHLESDPTSNRSKEKKIRPPPLMVDDKILFKILQELLEKDTSIAIKVFSQNIELHEKFKKILVEKKHQISHL